MLKKNNSEYYMKQEFPFNILTMSNCNYPRKNSNLFFNKRGGYYPQNKNENIVIKGDESFLDLYS